MSRGVFWRLASCSLVAVAALAAGCGGSSDGSSPSGASPAKAAYDVKLQRAARALAYGLNASFSISTKPRSPSAIASEARRTHTVLKAAAAELANARPPTDAESDNERVVAGLRFVDGEVTAYAKAAADRDWKAINRLNQEDAQSRTLDAALGGLDDLRKKGYPVAALPETEGVTSLGTSSKFCSNNRVTVPSVVGQPEQDAVRHLRDAGLDATVFPQIKPNPRVPAGVVVHESSPNFPVCKGTSVWIIVSIGKT